MSYETELTNYLDDLCAALGHRNRHAPFQGYCKGLMLPIERKCVEPIAAHIDPGNVRSRHQSLHHFVADAPWSDRKLLDGVTQKVLDAAGRNRQWHWIIDDTGMPKKGTHSVGVSHQYCGQLGRQANCQVAVSLSLATQTMSLPLDYQLYLPKNWIEDPARCAGVGVPEGTGFQTKQQIALQQLKNCCERDVPKGIVTADAAYGHDRVFREGVEALGLEYVLSVQLTTLVWPPGAEPRKPSQYKGTGRKPTRQRIAKGQEPQQIEKLALSLDAKQWRRLTWAEGSNGKLSSHFAFIRVRIAPKNHLSRPLEEEQWLIIEWPEGEDKPTKYWLSNLPASSTKQRLVKSAKVRWRIERDYQEMKQGLGLNQYEGRNWRGFHHHASLCIASYGFLIIQRLKYPELKKNNGQRKKPSLPDEYKPRGTPTNATPCL